jgi:hypothetical protein
MREKDAYSILYDNVLEKQALRILRLKSEFNVPKGLG